MAEQERQSSEGTSTEEELKVTVEALRERVEKLCNSKERLQGEIAHLTSANHDLKWRETDLHKKIEKLEAQKNLLLRMVEHLLNDLTRTDSDY